MFCVVPSISEAQPAAGPCRLNPTTCSVCTNVAFTPPLVTLKLNGYVPLATPDGTVNVAVSELSEPNGNCVPLNEQVTPVGNPEHVGVYGGMPPTVTGSDPGPSDPVTNELDPLPSTNSSATLSAIVWRFATLPSSARIVNVGRSALPPVRFVAFSVTDVLARPEGETSSVSESNVQLSPSNKSIQESLTVEPYPCDEVNETVMGTLLWPT